MAKKGKPTNLYLNTALKREAVQVAKERYDCSLSQLVDRLLRRELSLKRGLISQRAA